MLSPSDIRPAVREVLLSAENSLASYQILDRLPLALRNQIITERGMPGAGAGKHYTAASLVTDAIEGVLPSLDPPYRVYLDSRDMAFVVAGHTIRPGNAAIAFYQLTADTENGGNNTGSIRTAVQGASIMPDTVSSVTDSQPNQISMPKEAWYHTGWLWFWLLFCWPVGLYGIFKSHRVAPGVKWVVGGFFAFGGIVSLVQQNVQENRASPVSTAPPDSQRTAVAPEKPEVRVNNALAQSKQLLKESQYEKALEVLREVKALSPAKVLPQITRVRQTAGTSLTKIAKEIRRKEPALALEMLNRAASFGNKEASRLIPRVQREAAQHEKRVAQAAKRDQERWEEENGFSPQISPESAGIGLSYSQVTDYLTNVFDMQEASAVNGVSRMMGKSSNGIAILEVIGDASHVSQASLIIGLPKDDRATALVNSAMVLRFMRNVAPGFDEASDWLVRAMEKSLVTDNSVEMTWNNRRITLKVMQSIGMMTISVRHK